MFCRARGIKNYPRSYAPIKRYFFAPIKKKCFGICAKRCLYEHTFWPCLRMYQPDHSSLGNSRFTIRNVEFKSMENRQCDMEVDDNL